MYRSVLSAFIYENARGAREISAHLKEPQVVNIKPEPPITAHLIARVQLRRVKPPRNQSIFTYKILQTKAMDKAGEVGVAIKQHNQMSNHTGVQNNRYAT